MRKLILILSLAAGPMVAFAQGKVSLQNAGVSAITLGGYYFYPGDAAVAGLPIATTGPLPSGIMIEVGLYAGTSSTSLSLVSGEILNPIGGTGNAPGVIPVLHIVLPFAGGSLDYYEVRAWDSAYASYEAASHVLAYTGRNNMFTMTAGTSIAYVPVNGGGGSTWTAVGNDNPLFVGTLPEPNVCALVALGTATLLMRRRSFS